MAGVMLGSAAALAVPDIMGVESLPKAVESLRAAAARVAPTRPKATTHSADVKIAATTGWFDTALAAAAAPQPTGHADEPVAKPDAQVGTPPAATSELRDDVRTDDAATAPPQTPSAATVAALPEPPAPVVPDEAVVQPEPAASAVTPQTESQRPPVGTAKTMPSPLVMPAPDAGVPARAPAAVAAPVATADQAPRIEVARPHDPVTRKDGTGVAAATASMAPPGYVAAADAPKGEPLVSSIAILSPDPAAAAMGFADPLAVVTHQPGDLPKADTTPVDTKTVIAKPVEKPAKPVEKSVATIPVEKPVAAKPVETNPADAKPVQIAAKPPAPKAGDAVTIGVALPAAEEVPLPLARPDDVPPLSPAERLALSGKARARAEHCLAQAVYFEARNQPVRGQVAVAQVVINRVFSPYYPNDVCSVVFQNAHRRLACQFTFACDGKPETIRERASWARAQRIARQALDGKVWLPEVAKSTHYHAAYVRPRWVREMRTMVRFGLHTFYRPRRWGDGRNEPQWGVASTKKVKSSGS